MAIFLNKSKNYIINGRMDFWQRGTSGFLGSTSSLYAADRFRVEGAGTSSQFTSSRSSDIPSSEFSYSLLSSKTNTSLSEMYHVQRIERALLIPLFGKSVTFSLWCKGTTNRLGLVRIMIPTSGTVNGWSGLRTLQETIFAEQSFIFNGNWQKISFSFIMGASTQSGIAPLIQLGGTTAGDILMTTGWQLEEGVSSSNFEIAGGNIVNELQLCQRYYQKSYPVDIAPGTSTASGALIATVAATTLGNSYYRFPVEIRSTPVINLYSIIGTVGAMSNDNNSTDAVTGLTLNGNTGGISSISGTGLVTTEYYRYHFTADAEL